MALRSRNRQSHCTLRGQSVFAGILALFSAMTICWLPVTASAQTFAPVACTGVRPTQPPLPSHHLAALGMLDKIAPPNVGTIAVRSGAWSDPATWGGKTPTSRVVIPSGVDVVFDVKQSELYKSVRIEGCLELSSNTTTRLNAEFVYVAPNGELLAGTATAPVPPDVKAQIVFPDFGPLDVTSDPSLLGKGLVAAARVHMYGALKTSRMKVGIAPIRGDTTIQLAAAPTGWSVGDRIVLTGTKFVPQDIKNGVVRSSNTQDEIFYIMAINGSTIVVDKPLVYSHRSPDLAVAAYVVNYSRNIRLATYGGPRLPPSQRAHAMFMSWDTRLQAIEFYELGRTDKSVRAVDASELNSPSPTANVKGRYPLHLHRTGFPSDKNAPIIRDVAIWGSPGWGIAHHDAKAFLFQNNTWNTFGAGFMSEAGNETGAWVENTAVKGIGVPHLVKDGGDVSAFDLGRTGDGFWLQSRSIRLVRNVAAGMSGGMGFVYFHRGNDLGDRFPLTPGYFLWRICAPATMRFASQAIDKPNIAQFLENEVIASEVGFHVVKASPRDPHDFRSVIDNFYAWEVKSGVELTYTSKYTIRNSVLLANRDVRNTTGVKFGVNTYDLVLADSRVERFDWGVNLAKTNTVTFAPSNEYVVSGVTFKRINRAKYIFNDATDTILTSTPPPIATKLILQFGGGPVDVLSPGVNLEINGSKTDTFGRLTYPVVKNEFAIKQTNFNRLAAERGWYRLTTGGRAVVMPEFYSDRLTGEIFQKTFIARLRDSFPWPSKLIDGSAADQGALDPNATPPVAQDDSVTVSANATTVIRVTANDSSNDGALNASGHTYAKYGNVALRRDGDYEYTPYPDFTGTDQFTYWVRNRQGFVDRGTVNITVN